MSTSTSEERQPAGAAPNPTPIGLIGLAHADPTVFTDLRPRTAPPNQWRFAKYAAVGVVTLGAAFGVHRISTPEGLDAAEAPEPTIVASADAASGRAVEQSDGSSLRPPSRAIIPGAFGHSGAVRVRVVLPGELVALPLEFGSVTTGMQSQWIAFDGKPNEPVVMWPENGKLLAPARAGAFWLVLSRGSIADTVADIAVLVERPMPNASATGINGYHLGRWPKSAEGDPPRGFIEVTERIHDFALSPHLRLSDFVVHDQQSGFPKYLHVREPLLDKIELVVAEVAQMRGTNPALVKLNVVSGFRSPSHNGGLSGSASDSRHMYGDAADIGIDANNDGRLSEIDARLVAAAAEIVERKHPELVGGIGLYYNNSGGGWPYVHIDVRGTRARWRSSSRKNGAVDSLPAGASFDSTSSVSSVPSSVTDSPSVAPAVALPAGSLPASASSAITAPPASVSPVAPTETAPSPSSSPNSRASAAPSSSSTPTSRAATAKRTERRAVVSPTRRVTPTKRSTTQRGSGASVLVMPSGSTTTRPTAVPITPPRPTDDPFSDAARKFRTARP